MKIVSERKKKIDAEVDKEFKNKNGKKTDEIKKKKEHKYYKECRKESNTILDLKAELDDLIYGK